jgi:hypothetical protein
MSARMESWRDRLGDKPILPRLLLSAWGIRSLLWVAVWLRFFYLYCDFDGSFACVVGGFLETVFYSLPQVAVEMLGPPALALILGLALRWVVRAWAGHWSRALASRNSDENDPLSLNSPSHPVDLI